MSSNRPQKIYACVGELAVRWNDLELRLRRLAYSLTDDWFTVAVFSADMQVSALIQSMKTLATEYDVESAKLNKLMEATRPKIRHKVLLRDMIVGHVEGVLSCADRLRLYRNLYLHCINSPSREAPYFTIGGMTSRASRLSVYELPLKVREIRKVSAAIKRTVDYAKRIEACIKANEDHERRSRTKWPKKLTPYPKLKKPFSHFTDGTPLF